MKGWASPLAYYVNALIGANFRLEALVEPRSPRNSPPEYLQNFLYPRFAILSAAANSIPTGSRIRRRSNGST